MSMTEEQMNPLNDPASMKLLADWQKKEKELAKVRDEEMALRRQITEVFFPTPKEGTNSFKLNAGYRLKLNYSISRRPDRALLDQFRDTFEGAGINLDELIRNTPELRTGAYKALTDDQRKLFDQVLTIRPSAPSLDIELPKRAG